MPANGTTGSRVCNAWEFHYDKWQVEEDDKFFRLLQLLGDHVDETKKAIVFVDTQVRADNLFEQLLRNGYLSLSLHGGKEQEDRDSTISDFKRKDGPSVLVATGVAGRGLDVPSCAVRFLNWCITTLLICSIVDI